MAQQQQEIGERAGPAAPLVASARGAWAPVIEVFERDGCLVFCVDLPGVSRGDLKVEVIGNDLVVAGERQPEAPHAVYSERGYGCFERRIALPHGADPESVVASFDDGVLEVSVRTPERSAGGRQVEIKGGQEASVESIH